MSSVHISSVEPWFVMLVMWAITYMTNQLLGETIRRRDRPGWLTISTVYTFAMAKFVHVQVHGNEKAAKIEADNVSESGTKGANDHALSIKLKEQEVDRFKGAVVDGWWISDEG